MMSIRSLADFNGSSPGGAVTGFDTSPENSRRCWAVRCGGHRKCSWPGTIRVPWATDIVTAWDRISALPQPLDQHEPPLRSRKERPGPWNPGYAARQPGCHHLAEPKNKLHNRSRSRQQRFDPA
jgi:hypothetical protein